MKFKMPSLTRAIVLASFLLTTIYPAVNAKFLAMRPLNAREVYRLLKQSGRSDAIPQGRVITQGLAAMTGFALGLTKGLGTALLFDIVTANVTDLNLPGSSSNSAGGTRLTTQEVCFNSRNARSLEEAEAIAEAYSRDDTKEQEKRKVRPSEVERRVTRNRRNKRKSQRARKPSRLTVVKPTFATATGTQTGTATNTETTNPTTTATATDENAPATTTTGSGTNVDNGGGTGTTSTSTTSTGKEGAINCVVIQKPAAG